jgi:hypothetical protein
VPALDLVSSTFRTGSRVVLEAEAFLWPVALGETATAALSAGDRRPTHSPSSAALSQLQPPHRSLSLRQPRPPHPLGFMHSHPFPQPDPYPHSASTGRAIPALADSPDPINASVPAGLTPTPSVASATVPDPSGVPSPSVILFHTTAGQVAMTNAGGGTWRAREEGPDPASADLLRLLPAGRPAHRRGRDVLRSTAAFGGRYRRACRLERTARSVGKEG